MKNVIEGNKLIAGFMGASFKAQKIGENVRINTYWDNPPCYQGVSLENLKYHSSWDWLIPVVQKIDELGFNTQISRISVKISEILGEDKPIISLVCGDLSQKNNLVWLAVCEFINWYNQNKTA